MASATLSTLERLSPFGLRAALVGPAGHGHLSAFRQRGFLVIGRAQQATTSKSSADSLRSWLSRSAPVPLAGVTKVAMTPGLGGEATFGFGGEVACEGRNIRRVPYALFLTCSRNDGDLTSNGCLNIARKSADSL